MDTRTQISRTLPRLQWDRPKGNEMNALIRDLLITAASVLIGLALLAGFLWSAKYWLWSGPIQ